MRALDNLMFHVVGSPFSYLVRLAEGPLQVFLSYIHFTCFIGVALRSRVRPAPNYETVLFSSRIAP